MYAIRSYYAYAKENHKEQYKGKKFTDPYIWSVSTLRKILDRQEYLGHTVLHKSIGTNFKLHKRKETAKEEQYVFPNTHEAIIVITSYSIHYTKLYD